MPARSKVTPDTIVDGALALLVEQGLEAVTLRTLAGRLGVEAPSLYRHVDGKDKLLALVALRLFKRDLDAVGPCATWQAWVVRLGQLLWSTQTAIAGCSGLFLSTPFEPEQLDAMNRWFGEEMARFGINERVALEIQIAMLGLVIGLGGYESGPNREFFRRGVGLNTILSDSLEALVQGWEAKLMTTRRGEA